VPLEVHKHKKRADDHALPGTIVSPYHHEEVVLMASTSILRIPSWSNPHVPLPDACGPSPSHGEGSYTV